MVKSAFRPSDDATTLPFLVPANAMAVVELRRTTTIVQALIGDGVSISSEFSGSYLNGLVDDMTSMALKIIVDRVIEKQALYDMIKVITIIVVLNQIKYVECDV